MNLLNVVFYFALVIGIMLFGFDIMLRPTPWAHTRYRRALRAIYKGIHRQLSRFVRWAWREYRQFIFGTVTGALLVLYFTGHFR